MEDRLCRSRRALQQQWRQQRQQQALDRDLALGFWVPPERVGHSVTFAPFICSGFCLHTELH